MGEERRDVWDLLTLAFWSIFFLIGLMPELAFDAVRTAARVPTATALINSSAIITLAFAAYFGLFAYRRCLGAGLTAPIAQGKALEVGLLALVGFLELPAKGSIFQSRTLLAVLLALDDIPDQYLRAVILFVGASKLLAWSYLVSLVVRYHAFGNRNVFTEVPSLFPSMHRAQRPPEAGHPQAESAPGDLSPPDTDAEADGHAAAARREAAGK